MELKCAPATARWVSRRCAQCGQHVEIGMRDVDLRVLDAGGCVPAHKNRFAMGGGRQHDSRKPRHRCGAQQQLTPVAVVRARRKSVRRSMALSMGGRSAVAKDERFRSRARTWAISDASAGARARCGAQSPPHGVPPRRAQDWCVSFSMSGPRKTRLLPLP